MEAYVVCLFVLCFCDPRTIRKVRKRMTYVRSYEHRDRALFPENCNCFTRMAIVSRHSGKNALFPDFRERMAGSPMPLNKH